MQRRITLLRHGHADEHADDFARTLSVAGRAAAVRAGEALGRAGWRPSYVVSSAAPRALATAELAAKASGFSGGIVAERGLYLASDTQCLAALRQAPAGAASVLLVAHNPGLTKLAHDLCGHPSDLSPAEYASIELDLDAWSEL
ncbi:MAG TPA: histidine phosphatase family protein [Polyangiaceae bacterium]|nr:histidine phosphatase family protein [Polyangiaceae bacterium]